MNIPSHLLVSPDALRGAVRDAGFPVEGDDLSTLLGIVQRLAQTAIAEIRAPQIPSGGGLAALHAAVNLLEVIRVAAGEQSAPTYWLAAPPAEGSYPLLVVSPPRPAKACSAVSLDGPFTWLDAIDDALSSVIGRGWADEEAEEAQSVVQGILTGHVPLERLLKELTLFEGDMVPWLDVIDETLSWARDALEPAELGRRIGEAHDLVQGILTGHVPLGRLLERVPPEEQPVYQLEGGRT
jgi:hypothetical protein